MTFIIYDGKVHFWTFELSLCSVQYNTGSAVPWYTYFSFIDRITVFSSVMQYKSNISSIHIEAKNFRGRGDFQF